ncbi:MAG TPA: two-component regulator propeller domain-containing protein [Acidobacteriaceae bacterium]
MSWTRRDGAPSDIAALAQTADGYLWIGSSFGLYRFDGARFESYPFNDSDPRLPASNIAALAADAAGGLWIGYRMGGISYLRNGTITSYGGHDGLVGQSTEQLLCRSDGSVWGVADGVLIHFLGDRWENYSRKHGLDSEGLYTAFFDRDGNLWTADKNRLFEMKKGEDSFSLTPLSANVINQFVQLPSGAIWVSDAWKFVRPLQPVADDHAVRIPGVPTLLVDDIGSIWLANEFGGLTRIKNPGTPEQQKEDFKTENGLTDGQTHAILQDRQGTIWVGTARGLDRFRRTPLTPFLDVRLDYYPALIAARDGGIWLHDMDKPLMRLRDGHLTFVGKGHGSSTLFQDTDGSVWLLDQITRDFYRYPANGGEPTVLPAPPVARDVETWCLGRDARGEFIASFEGHGLWRYNGDWAPISAPGMPVESPTSMVKGENGRVWFGYPHDQIVLSDSNGFHTFGVEQGLQINSVFVFYDADNLILAGGSDGLAFFDGHLFHSLRVRSPEMLRGISGIVKDRNGDLWLNAVTGIIHVPMQQWKMALQDLYYSMDFQLLNEQDGLVGTPAQNKPTPSAVMDNSGALWFATSGHLVSLNPDQVSHAASSPTVQMQAVLVNRMPRSFSDEQKIVEGSRDLRSLEFDYIGIDLNAPDRVIYQYMLEGQDKDWQDAGSKRQANYTNLAPGDYRFRIRAASGTGPWNELPSSPRIYLRPPFYQAGWFYLLCVLLFFLLLWLLYTLRVRQLTDHLRGRMEERARERVRIARDLHDTLLQGIQGLVLRFHFAAEHLDEEDPVRAMLTSALDRADQVIKEGREKVTELRSEGAALAELEQHLRKAVNAMHVGSNCNVTIAVHGTPRMLQSAVQDELYWIGREALTNAVAHARATEILIEVDYQQEQISLRCTDNGCGIAGDLAYANKKEGHWGIIGMRERARTLNCRLEIESQPGVGTSIAITIPARRAYAAPPSSSLKRTLFALWPNKQDTGALKP